jgi:hypothetical protein
MSKPPSIPGRGSKASKVDVPESSSESQKPAGPERKAKPQQSPSDLLANLRPARQGPLGKRSSDDATAAPPPSKRPRKGIVRTGAPGGTSLSTDATPTPGAPQPATEETVRGDDIRETVGNAVRAFISQALKNGHPDHLDESLLKFASVDEYRELANAAIDTDEETQKGARLARLGARVADLTEPQRERFIDAVVGLKNEAARAEALEPLGVAMGSLSDLQQGRLVDSAIGLKYERDKSLALAGLGAGIAHLTESQRKRIIEAATGIEDEKYRALAMAGVGAGMAAMTNLSETGSRDGTPERG